MVLLEEGKIWDPTPCASWGLQGLKKEKSIACWGIGREGKETLRLRAGRKAKKGPRGKKMSKKNGKSMLMVEKKKRVKKSKSSTDLEDRHLSGKTQKGPAGAQAPSR